MQNYKICNTKIISDTVKIGYGNLIYSYTLRTWREAVRKQKMQCRQEVLLSACKQIQNCQICNTKIQSGKMLTYNRATNNY